MPKNCDQAGQPQDMVQVTMRKQDAPEMSKFSFRLLDLARCSLPAIDKKVEITVLHGQRGKSPLRRRR
jgi:hypothetical protein